MPELWKIINRKLGPKSAKAQTVKFCVFGGSTPSKFVRQIKDGLLGVHQRLLNGLGFNGASASQDVDSGGADSAMTRVMIDKYSDDTMNQSITGVSGKIKAIIAPDVLDRLDAYIHTGDQYGSTTNSYYKERKNLSGAISVINKGDHRDAELCLRFGVPSDAYLGLSVGSEDLREQVINEFKKEGISEVNGMPIESFVFLGENMQVGDIYEKLVKPAGF